MKKIASILGVSILSMAVGFGPAFAQQTKPQDPAGSATVQPKLDEKAPAAGAASKSEAGAPAKPATPAVDAKAGTTSTKTGTDVKAGTLPAKPDAGVKTEAATPAKPGDVKAGAVSTKPGKEAKDEKAAPVKQDAKAKPDSKTLTGSKDATPASKTPDKSLSGKSASTESKPGDAHHVKVPATSKDMDSKNVKSGSAKPASTPEPVKADPVK